VSVYVESIATCVESTPQGVKIGIKVVPGASRSKVAGVLGDRIKVAVSAQPEGGKANVAVLALFVKVLKVAKGDVEITSGFTQPRKILAVAGLVKNEVVAQLLAELG
jgi:uncharacterized protein